MAAIIIDRLDAPRGVGRIDISGADVKVAGVTVENVKASEGLAEFDVTLPFLPFFIPEKTSEVQELLPNLRPLNEFTLKVSGLDPNQKYSLVSEGKAGSSVFTGAELAEGVDVSMAAGAPWAEQARKVWDLARERNKICSEIWHALWEGEKPAKFQPFISRMSDESRAKLKEVSDKVAAAARVTTFHVALAKSAVGADKRMKSDAK